MVKKNDLSQNENKQYKYESPYIKNNNNVINNVNAGNNNLNNYNSNNNNIKQSINPQIKNNNVRPVSSKVENIPKNIASNIVSNNYINNNIVSSIKKVVVPEKKNRKSN